MTQASSAALQTTPLHACHRALGARMTPFGGWEMPVQYTGIQEEHRAVRTAAGLFDVSHMGEIEIAGRDALAAVQRITSNDAGRLDVGQAQYSALTTPGGTLVDDLVVPRLAPEHFLFVVNAANTIKDRKWIAAALATAGDAVAVDTSRRYALLALQGPRSPEILQALTAVDLSTLRYYAFAAGEVAGIRATIARTGYTGEDGFELFVAPQAAEALWTALLNAGAGAGLRPAGLGARDTLRLEASLRLYGQDIDESTTLLEAGLGWIVAWDKEEFVGREALVAQRAAGVGRRLVGFEMLDQGIPRAGYDVYSGGERVGRVTSGTWAPFLGKAIGMAYVPAAISAAGSEIAIEVRGRRARARVVRMPFYQRARS